MIYFPPNCCPETHKEAYRLQEQTVYLYYHMELVKQAIDVLQEKYLNKEAKSIKKDLKKESTVVAAYKSVQLQVEVVSTLIGDCLEYLTMLRGEENVYTDITDRIISVRNKIRELYSDM